MLVVVVVVVVGLVVELDQASFHHVKGGPTLFLCRKKCSDYLVSDL